MVRLIACLALALCAAAPLAAFEAGAGRADITGPVGAPLNGYGDRMGRGATGVHDPLWARALYLNDGTTGVFLVNCDLTVITRELRARVLELAPQVVPGGHVILTATHTHNAQGAMFHQLLPRFVGGRYIPEVLEATAAGIAQAMQQAYDSRQRATIGYGTSTQQDLSVNRRFPGGPIDEQIGVIRVDDADGNPIAVVANFAAHPTSVPKSDHLSYSADYPGFYYQELERRAPEGCTALFLNGALGNQTIGSPPPGFGGTGAWGRTEGVGRALADRVYKVAEGIACTEAELKINAMDAQLPPTLASALQPTSVLLQTLEIGDLLLTFFPGEAVVDIGLEMRRRALTFGYKAQFSVGLANDYLMYFIPRGFYHQVNYESTMNFFGPDIAEWFYRNFLSLASRATPPDMPDAVQPPREGAQLADVREVVLEGDGYRRGVQRALAFGEEIAALYEARLVGAIRSGALLPDAGVWGMVPPFVDPVPLALPVLAMTNRPLLEGISADSFDELRGMAEALGMPFDAVWLLQHAPLMESRGDKTGLFNAPLCTGVAVLGERAVGHGLLVGRTMDWRHNEAPVVVEVRPDQGRSYTQVGFAWNTGVFNGMNDAGLVVCVERMRELGEPPLQGPAVETLAAEWLRQFERVDDVLAAARSQRHLRGWHVLVAGTDAEDTHRAVVVEYGEKITVRETGEDGLLLGASPAAAQVDTEARSRYARAKALLDAAGAVDADMLGDILHDQGVKAEGMANIWNDYSRISIVFMPERGRFMLSVRGEDGQPGGYALYQPGVGGGT